MNNKKSWGEIQLAIAAVALAVTLGFWNLFSAGQKQQDTKSVADTAVPPTEDVAQVPAPTSMQGFLPVKIIFGGTAPQQNQKVVAPPSAPRVVKSKRPKPPVTTGSSKP
jgi:hypothetical protein